MVTNMFAKRLQELRNERRLSQRQLAEEVGISWANINRWENNIVIPKMDSIILLARFFGVSSDYLLGLVD